MEIYVTNSFGYGFGKVCLGINQLALFPDYKLSLLCLSNINFALFSLTNMRHERDERYRLARHQFHRVLEVAVVVEVHTVEVDRVDVSGFPHGEEMPGDALSSTQLHAAQIAE